MKALEIMRFELSYQSKRWWTWLYAVALLSISLLIATDGLPESAQAQGYWVNAPYAIALMTFIGNVMGLLVAAAFSGDAGARDRETRMDSLVYTSPIAERTYVGGRFSAAFLLNALILVSVQIALLIGLLVMDGPAELQGPIRIATYVSSYVVLALPGAFLATALLFSLSLVTRRAIASYLGAVILFFASLFTWLIVAQKLGQWQLAKIIDPLGLTVMTEISATTTGAQKNALSIWSSTSLLINRAVWMGVALVIVGATHLRFRFEAARSRTWFGRASTNIEPAERSVPATVPIVERSTGIAVRLNQLLVITMQSFREIAISWGGVVLVMLSLLIAVFGPKAMDHLGVPVIPTTEQMVNWIGHTGEIIWFIVPILTTFYAGELVWRDRETLLSEIADAAPVPEWVQLAGKFAGLALMLLAYQMLLVVACIVIQMRMGFYHIELGLYARTALGLSLVEHLIFAALAFALHVIINQKYVGYLALIGMYAFISGAALLGIQNHLLVYGSSPEWTYSDMRGFGPSLIAWGWFKTYWAAWALLLCIVATLFWVRGREAGFRARLALVRERLSPRTLGIAAAMMALIVGTGGFIAYNTSVLNRPTSEAELTDLRARYEKTYGKFAGMIQPEISGIALRVEIFPHERKATIHGKYALVNRSKSPISAIHLLPDDDIETSAAVFDRPVRGVVDDSSLHYRVYELGTPLAPADSLHVSFDVRFNPRGFSNDGVDPAVAANGTYFEGNDWLPKIGYQRGRELKGNGDRREHGLPPRPEIRSLDDTAARYSSSAKRIAFDAIVGTDDDQLAIAPGEVQRTWVENGRRYFHYVAAEPIRKDFAIYSSRYSVRTDRWKDVEIQVVHHPGHTTNVERMIESAKASLDYFTKTVGPYPYRELRLVEHPGQSMTLHASPINISYEEAFAGMNSKADPRGFDLASAVVAHEISHQWWGNQLSPADVEGGPLLTESLAWYSAMCIVARSRGEDHLQRLQDMMHLSSWSISSRAGVPLLQTSSFYAAYRKGPYAMFAVREYVGERHVDDALRRLFKRYKSGEPPLPTSRDLYTELERVTPDSLRPLLADLFERNTYWELKMKSVVTEPVGSQWRVTLDVNARKVTVDKRGIETEVPMDDLVEIGVYAEGGGTTRGSPIYSALHRIKTGPQQISVVLAARPDRAGIDPRYLLMDANPSDNIKDVSGHLIATIQ